MSDRRGDDENFIEECKRGQTKAVETVGFMQHFMTSSLQAINELTVRVARNESENGSKFAEVFSEQKGIRSDHKKILSLLSDSQLRNDDGFSKVIEKLDAQEIKIDSLDSKEKKRSFRERMIKGVFYAFILTFAGMGFYATSVILFGEYKVQKVLDLSKGKVR